MVRATMDPLAVRIASIYRHAADEAAFLAALRSLESEHGDRVYQSLLETLGGVSLDAASARHHASAMLEHRAEMSAVLGGEVLLVTAMSDYLYARRIGGERPRLVGLTEFERVLSEASHDPMTGLLNRGRFTDVLHQQFALAERAASSLALLFVDVDDFKSINDTLGHRAGDDALCRVASVLRGNVRDSDVAARYGGEEFVVLLPNTSALSAAVLAERMRAGIERQARGDGDTPARITVSIGVAAYPDHATSAEELLYHADSALYRAKGAGKNTTCLFAQENRRYVRIPLRESVQVQPLDFSTATVEWGEARDIGIGGILVRSTRCFALGETVKVGVRIAEQDLLLIGQVVRVEALDADGFDIGIALAFRELDKLARSGIAHLLGARRPAAQRGAPAG